MNSASRTSLFIVIVTYLQIMTSSAMSPRDYAKEVADEMDREYSPITAEKCRSSFRFRKLKSCSLLLKDQARLLAESKRFLNPEFNRWEGRQPASIDQPRKTNTEQLVTYYRRYRQSTSYRRSKRDTYWNSNPCAEKKAHKTILIHGIDAITDEVVEVLQDPGRNLYQTFFTHKCKKSKFYNMKCAVQYLEYLTAVFVPGTYKVTIRPVKFPFSCALEYKLT